MNFKLQNQKHAHSVKGKAYPFKKVFQAGKGKKTAPLPRDFYKSKNGKLPVFAYLGMGNCATEF